MTRGAFFVCEVGGGWQAMHDLALLVREFVPRAQARRIATGASGIGICHRANINGLEVAPQDGGAWTARC
jgi:hypothetical protein